jgi:hypothetical protein
VNNSTTSGTWSGQGSGLDNWANVKEFVPRQNNVNIVNTVEISNKDTVSVATTTGSEAGVKEDKSVEGVESYLDKEISENINKILSDDSSDDVQGLLNEHTDEKESEKSEIKSGAADVKKEKPDLDRALDRVTNQFNSSVAVIEESMHALKKKLVDTIAREMNDPTALAALNESVQVGENKNKKANEQNELPQNTIQHSGTKEVAVLAEPKLTKDKGVQSKPSTKTKIIMTEAMNEPYKAEYEKLLRSCQGWQSKYQELLDKNVQMEKKYGVDVVSLEKKLKDCGQKIEVGNPLFMYGVY